MAKQKDYTKLFMLTSLILFICLCSVAYAKFIYTPKIEMLALGNVNIPKAQATSLVEPLIQQGASAAIICDMDNKQCVGIKLK